MKHNEEIFNPAYIGFRRDIFNLIPVNISKVLDVGCNIGVFGEQLKKMRNVEVVGIELVEEMGEIAKGKLDRVIIGDLDQINLKDSLPTNYFDCMIFGDVLEHTKDPWKILTDSTIFLKNDGVIIASIPNIRHFTVIFNLLFKGYWPYRERGIHDKTHLRFFTLKNIKEMFLSANLKIIKIERNYRIIEKPHPYNRFFNWLGFLPVKEYFVFQYIIIAEKLKER